MSNPKGKILAVNIADQKGCKKTNVGYGQFIEDFGIQDDAHAGTAIRQVSLLAQESIDKMKAKGLDVTYGDFAENLTTEGLDLPSLPIGTKMRVGSGVLLEVTQIGKVCHDHCHIFYTMGDCVMPREGIFVKVLTGGGIKVGDKIEIVPE